MRIDELRLLFAMVRKIRVSYVQAMMRQWIGHIKTTGNIECTSLVTRIANGVGDLQNVGAISYITEPHELVDENYLIRSHTLKHNSDGSLVFFFPGYTNEIWLPNPDFTCMHRA